MKIPMMRNRIVLLVVVVFFAAIGWLFPFTGRVEPFDKDMAGEFEIEQQFIITSYDGETHQLKYIINAPENFESSQPVYVLPISSSDENTKIELSGAFKPLNGIELGLKAKYSLQYIFSFIYNWQLYPIPFTPDPWLGFQYGWMRDARQRNKKELEFESRLIAPTAADRLKSTGLAADKLFANDTGYIHGLEIHQRIKFAGISAWVVSMKDIDAFARYLESEEMFLPKEFGMLLDEYSKQGYVFAVFGISNIETYRKAYPVFYVLYLLEKSRISEIEPFLDSLSNEEIQRYGNRRAIEWLNEKLIGPIDPEGFGKDKRAKFQSVLFRNGMLPCISLSYQTSEPVIPLKQESIFDDRDISLVIYGMDYLSPQYSIRTQNGAKISYFYNFIDDVRYTKCKLYLESKLIEDDLLIRKKAPFKAKVQEEIFDYILYQPAFLGGIRDGILGLLFQIGLLVIPLSILASYFASLVAFRKSHIGRWKLALLGIFNIFTLVGLIVAVLLMRTRRIEKGEGEVVYTRKDLRKLWFIILFSIFFLAITAIIHLILNAMLL